MLEYAAVFVVFTTTILTKRHLEGYLLEDFLLTRATFIRRIAENWFRTDASDADKSAGGQ
jgi:hypothetical protein